MRGRHGAVLPGALYQLSQPRRFACIRYRLPPYSARVHRLLRASRPQGAPCRAGADYVVHISAAQTSGKLLKGGDFAQIAGQPRNYFARLNADGSLYAAFDPRPSNNRGAGVIKLAVQSDGKVLIGGNFTNIDGLPVRLIARLYADGKVEATLNATVDNAVP